MEDQNENRESISVGENKTKMFAFDSQYKVLMLGDSGVGKSSIILRFTNDKFTANFLPTIGIDFKAKMMSVPPNYSIKMVLWDSAGQERFRTITKSYLRGSHAVAIVYDCMDRTSFDHVSDWLADFEDLSISGAVLAVVANKCDMATKAVSEEEGREFAEQHGLPFFETSAKDNTGVDRLFMYFALELMRRENETKLLRVSSSSSYSNYNSGGVIRLTKPKLDALDGHGGRNPANSAPSCCGY